MGRKRDESKMKLNDSQFIALIFVMLFTFGILLGSVSVSNLEAKVVENHIVISWDAMHESNHAGYDVYRWESGRWAKLNSELITTPVSVESEIQHYEYLDEITHNGGFSYKVVDFFLDGESKHYGPVNVTVTSILENNNLVNKYDLEQNYPNPFNPVTTIDYHLAKSGQVSLTIYDMMRRLIEQLVSDYREKGAYSVQWDATNVSGARVPNGCYIYQLWTAEFVKSATMLMLK